MSTSEDADDLGLSAEANDAVSTGAAADSVDTNDSLKDLPRLLRYAMLVTNSADHIEQRLIAEIDELCPQLPQNAAWAKASGVDPGLALAAELDHRAVVQNEPNLRSLADCARLVCLPTPSDRTYFADHRRVGKALIQAFQAASRHVDDELCCDLEHFVFGWAALPSPIRDRFRVVSFPKPTADDLDALLPAVIADLARERSLDASWVPPLDGAEHAAVTRNWRGGSVRRLRRIVEAILRERDLHATRNWDARQH